MQNEKKVAEWKIEEVKELEKFIDDKKVIGVVDIESLPSRQLQEIRKKLRGKAEIRVSKSILIQKAIENLKREDLKKIEQYMEGPCGIIVSDEDPFKLCRFLKKNRSKALAKAGTIAPHDIIVPAGDTDLPAGPALSELKIAKIDVKLEKGKIAIAHDSLVAKKGEPINPQVANALAKLGITPMEIGLRIEAIVEKGMVYTYDVLDIDDEKFMADLVGGYRNALNLSVSAGYPNSESIMIMIQNAHRNARNLAVSADILTKETTGYVLAKANRQANVLSEILKSKGFSEV
jgi:large subunit ribosomal protein L10